MITPRSDRPSPNFLERRPLRVHLWMGVSLGGLHAAVPEYFADCVLVDAQPHQDAGARVAQVMKVHVRHAGGNTRPAPCRFYALDSERQWEVRQAWAQGWNDRN